MSKDEYSFRVGDAIWGKVKGYSAWPGKIVLPPDGMKRPAMKKVMHCILFFGTHDYAWIMEPDLKPYIDFREKLAGGKKKTGSFVKAIAEIEAYISGKGIELPELKTGSADESADDSKLEDAADAEFNALLSADKKAAAAAAGATPSSTAKKAKKRSASTDSDTDSSSTKKPKGRPDKKNRNGTAMADLSSVDEDNDSASPMVNHSKKKSVRDAVSNFLDRPKLDRPASPSLDISTSSQILRDKDIQPSKLSFGFLGLGIMGSGIVKNLLNSGHSVTVWNRTAEKRLEFTKNGAKEALTPGDVIAEADITFSCVSDPQAAKDMVFGNCGVLSEINTTKGYVEMTGIDADTSQDIAEAISLKGGRYLEAQVQGSKEQANDGTLVILVAGDKSLFDDCQSCFQAMGKFSFHLGEVGNASRMNLVLQLMSGVALAGLAEGMALADRAGLQQKDILEVLGLTGLACPMMVEKGKAILEGAFPPAHPLQHMQKDLKLSLNMGDQLEQPLPLTATANEVFKHAKRLGYGEHDTSAVYIRARF